MREKDIRTEDRHHRNQRDMRHVDNVCVSFDHGPETQVFLVLIILACSLCCVGGWTSLQIQHAERLHQAIGSPHQHPQGLRAHHEAGAGEWVVLEFCARCTGVGLGESRRQVTTVTTRFQTTKLQKWRRARLLICPTPV